MEFMSKNDDRILELKKQIEDKKTYLTNQRKKFSPETNCMLELDEIKYNINVIPEDILTTLIIKLNMYVISADNLGMPHPIINGYSVDLWILDIKNKLFTLGIKKEENDLKSMEASLTKMLSEDKKIELELDKIAATFMK
jgi:DNA polymerase III alpha subunit